MKYLPIEKHSKYSVNITLCDMQYLNTQQINFAF